ncbi:hypothetical protein QTP88_019747 [Uroleucon formosanum]
MCLSIDALEIMNTENNVINNNKSWIEKIRINDMETKIKLDTGAELKVISVEMIKKMKDIQFVKVVEYEGLPLLSYEACVSMQYKMPEIIIINSLITNNEVKEFIEKNIDVFEGIGKCPDKVQIKLTDNAIPKSNPSRRFPMKLMPKLKEQLERMVKLDIIKPCENLTEWQSKLVIIEKPDGTLRLCIDPREVNKYIVRDMYQIPTLNDIRPILANKSCYSLLGLKDGFYHCELDEESTKLCTFSSPFGSYSFKRLPFGISMAPELFQKRMSKYFGEIESIQIYFDDVLICANSREEHDQIMMKVLDRARRLNIKFSAKKIQFAVKEVKFLGFVFNMQGVMPDPKRIKIIKD